MSKKISKKISKNKSKNKSKKIPKNKSKKIPKNKHEVIGQGSFGCVIDPIINCSKKFDKNKYVSKLVDIRSLSKKDVSFIKKEVSLNKYIKNYDPNHKFLLTLDDNCTIKDLDKSYYKIFNKCGIQKKNNVILNMIYKKGVDFVKNIKNLTNKNITKVLYYLVEGLSFSLKKMNIILFDIHEGNLLFMKDEKTNKYYPVFIDFTPNYVYKNTPHSVYEYFYNYYEYFVDMDDYSIETILFDVFTYYFTKKEGTKSQLSSISYFHNEKYDNEVYSSIYNKYYKIITQKIGPKKKSTFIEKILLFRLGYCFRFNKNFMKNKFLKMLYQIDITSLPDIDTLSKLLKEELKIKDSDSLSKLHIKL
jgi:hypothetical protein